MIDAGSSRPEARARRRSTRPRGAIEQRALAFAIAALLPIVLALNNGGYDIVTRQEAGLAIWWALALAIAFGVLPRARPEGVRGPLVALALLLAWSTLSLTWTESDERTFAEITRILTFSGVLVLALYGLGPRTWTSAAAGLTTAALLIPALAVLSRLAPDAALPGALAFNLEIDRLIYPLGYWNAVAAWSAMAIAIALAWSAHLRPLGLRGLALALVPVAGFATYLTYSRAGVIGVLIGVLVVVALARNRWTAAVHALVAGLGTVLVILVARGEEEIANGTGGDGGVLVGVVLLVVCTGCGLAAAATAGSRLERRQTPGWLRPAAAFLATTAAVAGLVLGPALAASAVDELTADTYPAESDDPASRLVDLGSSRPEVWSEALDAFATDPLKGIGPGTFEFWWAREGADEYLRDAHSLYLEVLAELGVPGLVLVVILLGGLFTAALRGRAVARRSVPVAATTGLVAAFAVYLYYAGVDWMWESTAVTVLGLSGAAAAAAALSTSSGGRSARRRGRLVATVAAIVAGAAQIPGTVAEERVRASQFERLLGDLERARSIADDAVAAEPWAATPRAERAVVALLGGNVGRAREDAREAIEREPTSWWHRFLLLRIEVLRGADQAALDALDATLDLRPSLPVDEGDVRRALEAGRTGDAIISLDRAR